MDLGINRVTIVIRVKSRMSRTDVHTVSRVCLDLICFQIVLIYFCFYDSVLLKSDICCVDLLHQIETKSRQNQFMIHENRSEILQKDLDLEQKPVFF